MGSAGEGEPVKKELQAPMEHKGSCKQQKAVETFTEENGRLDHVNLEGKLKAGYSPAHCSGGKQTGLGSNWKWVILGLMARAVADRGLFQRQWQSIWGGSQHSNLLSHHRMNMVFSLMASLSTNGQICAGMIDLEDMMSF